MQETTRARFAAWVQEQGDEGVSQAAIARRMGCSPSLITYLLNGERSPGLRTAISIERLSGIPAASWLEEVAA